jgi:hypothetical protein
MMGVDMSMPTEPEHPPASSEADRAAELGFRPPADPGELQGLSEAPEAEDEAATQGTIPGRLRRRTKAERVSMRVLATGGIIGIATVLGAVLVGQDVAGWIVGLTVGVTSVVLAVVLWSSKQL